QETEPTLVQSAQETLSLYHLLDPEVLANPYPLYARLRSEDPVHWDPYLHAWIVTRYEDVIHVLTYFSANRTPSPAYFEALGAPAEDDVQLKNWSVTVAEMLGNFQHNPDRLPGVLRAVEGLSAYFQDAIRQQREQPREGLIQTFMTAEVDGDRLSDEEIVA